MKSKYTKRQIVESIKHWKKVLESMDENETIHDDQVSEDTKLHLDVPGTDGASIEVKGDWDAVRFCVDMMTDALNHMKAKDHVHYEGVSLHVDGSLDESGFGYEEFKPNKYFIEMFKCDKNGKIDDSDIGISDSGKELKQYYQDIGLDRMFKNKHDALKAVRQASKELLDILNAEHVDILNAEYEVDDGIVSSGDLFTGEDYHVLAVLRHGDEYENDVVACFVDGKLSPRASIEN